MAQQFATLALNGLPALVQNYDTLVGRVHRISIPGRKKSQNIKDDGYQSDYDYRYSSRQENMDRARGRDRGGLYSAPLARQDRYSQPRPSSVESIPRDFPPPGPTYSSRRNGPKSAGHDPYSPDSRRGSRNDYRPQSYRSYESSSDSESSPPPRHNDRRRRNTLGDAALGGIAAAGAYGAKRASDDKKKRYADSSHSPDEGRREGDDRISKSKSKDTGKKEERSDDDSGSDTSSEVASSEDERRQKHMRAKELLTAGLAAVATVHAASGVYNSMEARDKRMEKVRNGKMSTEEARKERTKALVQDFAAVGVAALSIKGAMAKWKGASQVHQTRKQHKLEREERRQRRLEKASTYNEKSSNGGSQQMEKQQQRPGYNRSYSRSEPDLSREPYNGTPGRYVPAQYRDDNPYGPYGRR